MTITQITRTTIGKPIHRKGLTIFPLSLPIDRTGGARVADDTLEVSELPSATVPQLQVHNPGDVPLLIPAGRVLEGGRQTRTVNVSILVPAGATVVIPVSCVEAGRWHGGRAFRDPKRYVSRRARVAKMRGVKSNLDLHNSKFSDQRAVWDSVSAELTTRHLQSSSELYLDAERVIDDTPELRELASELIERGIEPGQTGLAIAHGDKVVGVELFTTPGDLAASWEALVRMIVMDADVNRRGATTDQQVDEVATATVADVEAFLARVAAQEATTTEGTGLGTEYHVASDDLVAQALVDETGNLVHASAFVEA